MAEAPVNIPVNIETGSAIAQIKKLQTAISSFHSSMASAGKAANNELANMQQNLINNVNAIGGGNAFASRIVKVRSETEAFTRSLERNDFTLRQNFKNAAASIGMFSGKLRTELDTIQKVAESRVRTLQTQYINLGRDASGAMRAIAIRPLSLDMNDLGVKAQVTAQKMQIFGESMKQGSTQLLNFGKNTQWAGRQLMVGFTIPLSMMGAAAAKSFMELEKQTIAFKRVYGDLNTTTDQTNQAAKAVQDLAVNFTQYGVSLSDTMSLAAKAAAMGKTGADLMAQVSETTRLSVLGNVDQQQALETTISLTNAFGTAAEELAGKIDFLNAVENQTVTSIDDLTEAIPKAGPVVQQLGGNVEDLTFFLTAMREGGINAAEGANALKSGLASIINPTTQATDMLNSFGINLQGIVDKDRGNVKQMIIDLGTALDDLDPTDRARAIEQLFGKFQFARMSALFQNVIAEGSQANKVLELTNATSAELAKLSERELAKVSESTTYKFEKALADFQTAFAPIGELFLKIATWAIDFGTSVAKAFNGLSDGTKTFLAVLTVGLFGAMPVIVMMVGLFTNFGSFLIRLGGNVVSFFGKIKAGGADIRYMSQAELEAEAMAASLDQTHAKLTQTFDIQRSHMEALIGTYDRLIARQAEMLGMGAAVAPGKVAANAAGGTVNKSTTQSGLQRGHIAPALTGTAAGNAAIAASSFAGLPALFKPYLSVVGNLVADMSTEMNQALKNKGMGSDAFLGEWNSRNGRLSGSARLAGLDPEDQQTQKSLDELQKRIGERAVQLGKGTVTDREVEKATTQILAEAKKLGGAEASAAAALQKLAKQAGAVRLNIPAKDLRGMLDNGTAEVRGSSIVHKKTGIELGRISSNGKTIRPASQHNFSGNYKKAGTESRLAVAPTIKASKPKYPLAPGYTYVNGKYIDPEGRQTTGQAMMAAQQPTQSSKAKPTFRQRLGNATRGFGKRMTGMGGMMLGGGLMGAGAIAGMMGNEGLASGLNIAGTVAMAVGSIGTLIPMIQSFAAAIAGIVGVTSAAVLGVMGVVAAIGVLAFMAWKHNEDMKKIATETKATSDSLGASQSAMQKMAEAQGKVLPSDVIAQQRSDMIAGMQREQPGQATFGETYLQGDAGKSLTESIKTATSSGLSSAFTSTSIAQQLASGLANGLITVDEANSVAEAIGAQFNDMTLAPSIKSHLAELIGPDGQDVLKNGVDLQVRLIEDISNPNNNAAISTLTDKKTVNAGRFGSRTMYAATDEQRAASIGMEASIMGQRVTIVQQTMDALELSYQKDEISLEEYNKRRTELLEAGKEAYKQNFADIQALDDQQKNSLNTALTTSITDKFKGTPQETAANLALANAGTLSTTAQLTIKTSIDTGALSPTAFNNIFNTFDGNEAGISKAINLDVSYGAGSAEIIGQLEPFLGKGDTAQVVDILFNLAETNPEQGQRIMDTIDQINSDPFLNGQEKAAIIEYTANNADEVFGLVDAWDAKPDRTLHEAEQFFKQQGYEGLAAMWNQFAGLPDSVQKMAMMHYMTVYDKVMNEVKSKDGKIVEGSIAGISIWKLSQDTAKKQTQAYFTKSTTPTIDGAPKPTTTTPTGGGSGGGGGGGGGSDSSSTAEKKDPQLEKAQKAKDYIDKQLAVVNLKEKEINKTYEARKEALQKIADLNKQIAEQQRDQLTLADALSKGDISAAARAAQQYRANAAQRAQEMQSKALEKSQQLAVDNIMVNGKTKKQLEDELAAIEMKIALRELELAKKENGGAQASGGQKGNGGGRQGMVKGADGNWYNPKYYGKGGIVSYFASGGPVGTDTIPAMLTPGEFVIKKPAVDKIGIGKLNQINSGNAGSESVYNYGITINAGYGTDADEIARVVMQQIKRTESYALKGNKVK